MKIFSSILSGVEFNRRTKPVVLFVAALGLFHFGGLFLLIFLGLLEAYPFSVQIFFKISNLKIVIGIVVSLALTYFCILLIKKCLI